jgi:hypothetical protein
MRNQPIQVLRCGGASGTDGWEPPHFRFSLDKPALFGRLFVGFVAGFVSIESASHRLL